MAKHIVYAKTCSDCNILKSSKDFFGTTISVRFPERATVCKPCLQIRRFWSYVLKTETCWVWTGACKHRDGYGLFDHTTAHQFSWTLHNSPIPKGLCVLHHCDNPPCIRPDHLYCGTKKQNYEDMISRQRASAEWLAHQQNCILTAELVRKAREMYATGQFSHEQIRRILNLRVATVTVQQAVSGHNWKHL